MRWIEVMLLAGAAIIGVLLSGCAAISPGASAVGGWWTHKRIDGLETGRVENLEQRVTHIENNQWGGP